MSNASTWVAVLVTTAAGVQVLTLSLAGWSIANAVGYVGTVNKYGIKNGKRIAANAILWRAIALAVTVVIMGSKSAIILIYLDYQLETDVAEVWRAITLLSASIGLAVMCTADVYERVSLDHLVDKNAEDSFDNKGG